MESVSYGNSNFRRSVRSVTDQPIDLPKDVNEDFFRKALFSLYFSEFVNTEPEALKYILKSMGFFDSQEYYKFLFIWRNARGPD
jgi:hypothetical protein